MLVADIYTFVFLHANRYLKTNCGGAGFKLKFSLQMCLQALRLFVSLYSQRQHGG